MNWNIPSSLRPSAQKRNPRILSVHRFGWRWDVALFGSKKSWTGKTFILHCGLTGLSFCRQSCLLEYGFCDFAFGYMQNDRLRGVLGRVKVFIFEWLTIREFGALSMDYWLMLYVVVLECWCTYWIYRLRLFVFSIDEALSIGFGMVLIILVIDWCVYCFLEWSCALCL